MTLDNGALLSHYRIERPLGDGGMGQVFLATDTRLGRHVAIKVLPREMAGDADRMARFLQEARIASTLNHPNVAHLYEIGEAGGLTFLAMEYVEGVTLQAKIAEGPLSLDQILSIGVQIADALDAAHARGIVHRDIKPSNVLLTPRGHVKVLDFGLAKMNARNGAPKLETQLITEIGVVLGTVQYMSPEQALGHDLDARSDLFSTGVVLYEMATRRLPFSAPTAQETMARILRDTPDAMSRFNYEVPEEFDRVVRKCLEKNRDRRYQSARELLVDLRNLQRDSASHEAESAPPPGKSVIRAVIVDDEELARHIVREYADACGGIEIIAECSNGFEAVKVIGETQPDLVFLDVQMPKLDGFEVLELIGPGVAVIFTTAFDTYAMKAFDAHAVDYLLKPFGADRFSTAIERARQRLGTASAAERAPAGSDLSNAARREGEHAHRIVVKDGAKVHIIPLDKLDYAEAQDDYVALHCGGKSYLKQQTISSLEASLDPNQFVRIHRSAIVNLDRIAKIEPYTKDTRVAVLHDGTQLPISRAGYARLRELLDGGG